MPPKRIVLLAQAGASTNILFHAVSKQYPIHRVILEEGESTKTFLRRRAKRLGWGTVAGQVLFLLYQRLILQPAARQRRQEIKQQYELDDRPIPDERITRVATCNSEDCRELLTAIQPDLVLINGTRIIGRKTIAAAGCPMLNIHAGITPKYRGVHGGYWALRQGEPEFCGVSLHVIDPGIDTGAVIDQALIHPTPADTFASYPLLQLAAGLNLLLRHLPALLRGEIKTKPPLTRESRLWYHPTLWEYWRHSVK